MKSVAHSRQALPSLLRGGAGVGSLHSGGFAAPPSTYIIMCIRLREVFRFVLFDPAQFPNDGTEAEYQEINQSQLQRANAYPVNLSGGQ